MLAALKLYISKKLTDTALQEALAGVSGEWSYADPIYRFYHHTFKVYGLQGEYSDSNAGWDQVERRVRRHFKRLLRL